MLEIGLSWVLFWLLHSVLDLELALSAIVTGLVFVSLGL